MPIRRVLALTLCVLLTPIATRLHGAQAPTPTPAAPAPAPSPGSGPSATPLPQRPTRPGLPGMPPRDNQTPPVTGTGAIRGRVVAADSGQPLRRVSIRLTAPEVRQQKIAMTDPQGLFEIRDLPPGRYQLMATKGGYVNTAYGARRPGDMGRPLELADGQKIEGLQLTMAAGGVITGRIVDEFGEPVADATVTAVRHRYVNGRRRPMMAGRPDQSNDIGQFRLFGLPPGEYLVSASLRSAGAFGSGNEVMAPDVTGYAPTYFPGTASAAESQRVQVTAGSESIADIQLVPARLTRIMGTVIDSSGKPARGGMVRATPKDEGGFAMGNMSQIRPDGAFTLNGITPGDYNIEVRANLDLEGAATRGSANPFESSELAIVPVTAAGDDIPSLRIVTSKGLTVPGQATFDGGSPPTDQDVRVTAVPEGDGPMMGFASARVAADGTFELANLLGQRRLTAMAPRGWMVRSITYRGRDVTEEAVDFRPGGPAGRLDVVFTNRLTVVQGGAQDGSGRPLVEYDVLVFPADASKRLPFQASRGAKPDQQGRFKVEGLRPGDYLAIALADVDDEQRGDPEYLERLRPQATAFTIKEGETRSLTLTLSAPVQ